MKQFIGMLCCLCFWVTIPTHAQDCGLEIDTEAGDFALLSSGLPNNIRAEADTTADRLGQIPPNGFFVLLSEGVCSEGVTWFEVQTPTIIGWTIGSSDNTVFFETYSGTLAGSRDVGFILPDGLASGATVETIEATERFPSYRLITFEDFVEVSGDNFVEARIRIFDATVFENLSGQAADGATFAFPLIADLIASEDDLSAFATNEIPEFALGSAQIAFASPMYIPNYDGMGYRYIASYAQNFVSVTNDFLEYRYQGYSSDNAYFIDASFPIDAPESDFPIYDAVAGAN
ncbi:MAG: SH3 domain-containing protein, partial [Chloroflexota bacterium]